VREPEASRVALVLPVHATPFARAATQVVVFLLRTTRRTELALLSGDAFVPPVPGAPERFGLLFVAAHVRPALANEAARIRLERLVRLQVERAYARQGIADVDYELASCNHWPAGVANDDAQHRDDAAPRLDRKRQREPRH
jgi:hypothetical protein